MFGLKTLNIFFNNTIKLNQNTLTKHINFWSPNKCFFFQSNTKLMSRRKNVNHSHCQFHKKIIKYFTNVMVFSVVLKISIVFLTAT